MGLTAAQITRLTNAINKKVNIPIIGEKIEGKLIGFGIRKIDKALEDILPDVFYSYITKSTQGLSKQEARLLRKQTVAILNDEINLPFIREKKEGKLIGAVLDFLTEAMQKGNTLNAITKVEKK